MEDSGVVLLDFRALLEAAPDGIAVVDDRGRILVVNEQLGHLFGYTPSELQGMRVEMLVPERLREGHIGHRRSYTGSPATRPMGMGLELLGVRKDGTEFPLEISLSPVKAGSQTFTIAIVRDSTERRRLQTEEQALRTFLDTEQERHRIGMDLHDGIMQDIYAVTLGLELAHEDIDSQPAMAKDAIGRSIDQLHDVIRDIRSYIFDLRPRQFNGDLRQALLDLGREFQENSSIHTDVSVPTELPPLEYSIGVAYYIITHEALSNTRKYAAGRRGLDPPASQRRHTGAGGLGRREGLRYVGRDAGASPRSAKHGQPGRDRWRRVRDRKRARTGHSHPRRALHYLTLAALHTDHATNNRRLGSRLKEPNGLGCASANQRGLNYPKRAGVTSMQAGKFNVLVVSANERFKRVLPLLLNRHKELNLLAA